MSKERYVVVVTNVRTGDDRRDEHRRPETVICRLVFDDRDTAYRTAQRLSAEPRVLAAADRVKILIREC